MSVAHSRAIPTLGYPNRKAAIIGLARSGVEPRSISAQTGAKINEVHRALAEYRSAGGADIVAPVVRAPKAANENRYDGIWDLDEDERRREFARRAAHGARDLLKQEFTPLPPKPPTKLRLKRPGPTAPRWRHILFEAAVKHQIVPSVILGTSHQPAIVAARYDAMFRMHQSGMSLAEIGRRMNRNHSTVLSAVRKLQAAAQ